MLVGMEEFEVLNSNDGLRGNGKLGYDNPREMESLIKQQKRTSFFYTQCHGRCCFFAAIVVVPERLRV
jgi:hypothetical protein